MYLRGLALPRCRWRGEWLSCSSLWGPTRRLDIEATLDFSGDTDLAGLMGIESDVLAISQEFVEGLGDASRRSSRNIQTGMDNELVVLVDDDKLAAVGEGHGSLLG